MRRRVERRSAVTLVYLRGLPRFVVPLVVLAVAAGGVLAPPPVGGVLLALVLVGIAWLAYLSWPALDPAGRVVRALVLVLLAVAVGLRLT